MVLRVFCLPRAICNHAIGREHKLGHRMVAGTIIMGIGVGVAKSVVFFEAPALHFTLDLVGYMIHGLGCTPFIEYLVGEDHQDKE